LYDTAQGINKFLEKLRLVVLGTTDKART
jgi:hypothetical protein